MPTGTRGPYAKSATQAKALARLLGRLQGRGITTLSGIAEELTRRGIPPPGRRPWDDMAVFRVRRTLARLRAQQAAARRLREGLAALARTMERQRPMGSGPALQALAERQRQAIAGILACHPDLRGKAKGLLREVVLQAAQAVALHRCQPWDPDPVPTPEELRRLHGAMAGIVAEAGLRGSQGAALTSAS